MTEAEELELLELEEKAAQTAKPAAQTTPPAAALSMAGHPLGAQEDQGKGHLAQELDDFTTGATSRLRAAVNGFTLRHAADVLGKMEPEKAGNYAREYHQASEEHPVYELLGSALTPIPGLGKLKALKGIGGFLLRRAANAAVGAGAGAATGDTNVPLATRAFIGGGAGFVGGAVAEGLGAAAGKLLRGLVKPSAAAQVLRDKGVELTVGQMQPGGVMSKLEEAGQHSILGGQAIHDAQAAAREGWQHAVVNEARPVPGALRPGNIKEKLAGAAEDFGPAYQHAGEAPVLAGAAGKGPGGLVSLREAFTKAAEDPSVYATEADVNAAKRFLDNQVTLVERAMESKGNEPLKAQALIDVRQNIRAAIRAARTKGDTTAVDLLGNAEEAITGSLQKQLPPDAKAALHAVDSKYGDFLKVQDAVAKGKDQPLGFTPKQLSQAVSSGTSKSSYARGAGGPLRDLAAAGIEVLDSKAPMTGVQALKVPVGLHHVAAPLMALANTAPVKSALLGETALQAALLRKLPQLQSLLPNGTTAMEERLFPLGPAPLPAYADDSNTTPAMAHLLRGGR